MFPVHPGRPDDFFRPGDHVDIGALVLVRRNGESPFDLVAMGTLNGREPALTPT